LKIYIYGNQSFKKEIHQTLEHSNIKLKINTDILIEEINSLTKLKQTINENPKDIYLIDDEKIIKKNSLNKKIKFLAPKDGIEEEFLLESGVSDLALDSLKELPKYIIKKYEELKYEEPSELNIPPVIENKTENVESDFIELDEELSMLLAKGDKKDSIIEESTSPDDLDDIFEIEKDINLDDIDDFINNIDNAQNDKLEDDNFEEVLNFNDNFGLNNISYDYDDDDVLYREENVDTKEMVSEKDLARLDELNFFGEEIIEEDDETFTNLDDFDFLNKEVEEIVQNSNDEEKNEDFISSDRIDNEFSNDFSFFSEVEKEYKQIDESLQGDKMVDEFFELDSISEKDLLEALNCKGEEKNYKSDYKSVDLESKNESLSINSSNVNDLSLLISKLLNNKTLEITIKIKD
jgi:hypothetical protein